MTECPVCFGDGQIDFRDDDARISERFSDAELALMRRRGFIHPAGVVECDECDGTGVVTEERARDVAAWATAMVDQAVAEYERRERETR